MVVITKLLVRASRPHGSSRNLLCWSTAAIARGSSAWTSSARMPPMSMTGSAWRCHATLSGPNRPTSPTFLDCDTLHPVPDLGRERDVHAVDDVAEQVVRLVELAGAVVDADEELRAVGVLARVRHRNRAERVLTFHRLVLELVPGTARAGALRASTLDDEVRYHAVEREPVVVPLARQGDEIVGCLRRECRIQIEHHRAAVRRDRRPVSLVLVDLHGGRLCHPALLSSRAQGEAGTVVEVDAIFSVTVVRSSCAPSA